MRVICIKGCETLQENQTYTIVTEYPKHYRVLGDDGKYRKYGKSRFNEVRE